VGGGEVVVGVGLRGQVSGAAGDLEGGLVGLCPVGPMAAQHEEPNRARASWGASSPGTPGVAAARPWQALVGQVPANAPNPVFDRHDAWLAAQRKAAADKARLATLQKAGIAAAPVALLLVILIGQPLPRTHALLERLVDAQLLETPEPGRYRLHDLVRLYGREQAASRHPEHERRAALARLRRAWSGVALEAPPPGGGHARRQGVLTDARR
jgi:hypothetical protein